MSLVRKTLNLGSLELQGDISNSQGFFSAETDSVKKIIEEVDATGRYQSPTPHLGANDPQHIPKGRVLSVMYFSQETIKGAMDPLRLSLPFEDFYFAGKPASISIEYSARE